MKETPRVTQAVLLWLEEAFPNRIPDKPISEVELARLIGQQDVLKNLRAVSQRPH